MSVHADWTEDTALLNRIGLALFRLVVKARSLAATGRKLRPPARSGRTTRDAAAGRRCRI